jgi:geranylgeranyl pyrophosphate synthase
VNDSDAFRSYLAAARVAVDGELDRLLPAAGEPSARLHEAMRYGLFAGGKRLRPALCLLAGELYGGDRESLLPGAAALEMVHTFSLIHDDLPALDDDDLRRGQPTVHRRYDEATALLVGDGLLALAMTVLVSEPPAMAAERRLWAARVVGRAVGSMGMIGGQMADLEAERTWPEEARAALESIHRRKTGALIVASMRIGGIYAGAGEEADGLLTALAERLGLMFQISDDILDVEGSDETLGKTAGKDARANKLTYPALLGLEESRRLLGRIADEAGDLVARLPGEAGEDVVLSLIRFVATRDR